MSSPTTKTNCQECGTEILQITADVNESLCMACANRPPPRKSIVRGPLRIQESYGIGSSPDVYVAEGSTDFESLHPEIKRYFGPLIGRAYDGSYVYQPSRSTELYALITPTRVEFLFPRKPFSIRFFPPILRRHKLIRVIDAANLKPAEQGVDDQAAAAVEPKP